jgi:hypothetical protein
MHRVLGRRSPPSLSDNIIWILRGHVAASSFPLSVAYFLHVLSVPVDVMLVLDELVLHLLFQLGALLTQVRQTINHVLHAMKAVVAAPLLPFRTAQAHLSMNSHR